MAQSFIGRKRLRKYYGKIREVLDMPNLIEVQKYSYDLFLNSGDQGSPLDGEMMQRYREVARKNQIWLSLGGFHEKPVPGPTGG